MNWWLFACVASAVFALTIAGVLAAFWFAGRAIDATHTDSRDYERQLAEGEGCPWPIKRER